jgi:hypothetical protein
MFTFPLGGGGGGLETVTGSLPLIEPEAAVMVAVPAATPETSPEPFTVATAVGEELHVTDAVMSVVVLSE